MYNKANMSRIIFVFILSMSFFFKVTEGQTDQTSSLNFVASNVQDGRRLTRVAYKGILGMESVVDQTGKSGIFWRQVTDGHKLVMLLYQGLDQLLTCTIARETEDMQRFVEDDFLPGLIGHVQHTKDNVVNTVNNVGSDKILDLLGKEGNLSFHSANLDVEDYLDLLDLKGMLKQCRDYFKEVKRVSVKQEVTSKDNELEDSQIDREKKARPKRETERYNIYPGTKWCGYDTISDNYFDLGDNRNPDRCCRTHDRCPFAITPFTRKYGYYNYWWNTMLHCDCDERFRTCLKFQNNPVADNVGTFFFNMIKNHCFVLKRKEVCVKRSFWGRCTQYKKRFRAEVLEPLRY